MSNTAMIDTADVETPAVMRRESVEMTATIEITIPFSIRYSALALSKTPIKLDGWHLCAEQAEDLAAALTKAAALVRGVA